MNRPLQNRVTPEGDIVAVPERGLLMGNRGGQLHRPDRTLTNRRWASRAWITCLLSYKGRHEIIMAPRHYTQLFFLDEATALAAGHRPCGLCRRADYLSFAKLFGVVHGTAPMRADVMDRILHGERLTPERSKASYSARIEDLADGAMLRHDGRPHLLWTGHVWPWWPAGYGAPVPPPRGTVVVLTPATIVAILRHGYRPLVHPSAG